jgi:putative membrane protein
MRERMHSTQTFLARKRAVQCDGEQFAPGFKIAAVLVLSGLHGYFSASAKRFAEDRNEKPARHWRFMNEAPTALMIVIVILAVIKPWS